MDGHEDTPTEKTAGAYGTEYRETPGEESRRGRRARRAERRRIIGSSEVGEEHRTADEHGIPPRNAVQFNCYSVTREVRRPKLIPSIRAELDDLVQSINEAPDLREAGNRRGSRGT